jgi:hypothetical protein
VTQEDKDSYKKARQIYKEDEIPYVYERVEEICYLSYRIHFHERKPSLNQWMIITKRNHEYVQLASRDTCGVSNQTGFCEAGHVEEGKRQAWTFVYVFSSKVRKSREIGLFMPI